MLALGGWTRDAASAHAWNELAVPRPSLAVKRKRDLAPLGDVEEWFSKCEAGIVAAINAAYHDGAGADSAGTE